jgi:hypothetical protein
MYDCMYTVNPLSLWHFVISVAPMMYIPNQLIGAPLHTQVTIECVTEASPKVFFTHDAVIERRYLEISWKELNRIE